MDIFTAHPVLLWAVVGLIAVIAFVLLLPIVLSIFALFAAAFTMISVGIGEIFGAKWGWAFVATTAALIIVTILCFTL